ncbi:MAG: hypothetical protein BWK79_13510 [Beggiatoa sp. IS2]|nr:MAG: hypothetical protein BWK79_13510 [Beggiatoa sp. IS2]
MFRLKTRRWLYSFGRGLPLTAKVLVLTLVIGAVTWVILDYIQNQDIRKFFLAELAKELEVQARDDRTLFDQHIRSFQQAAKIITSQQRFQTYLTSVDWQKQPLDKIQHHYSLPPWLPTASVMQAFFFARYALLLDDKGQVREIYHHFPEEPPTLLTEPTPLLQKLSHNQTYMTMLDNFPYVLTSQPIENSEEQPVAILLLASPLDDEFLKTVSGRSQKIISLIAGDPPKVLASNHPELIPTGTLVNTLTADYLTTGKSYFDYGDSDLEVGFVSFVSTHTAYQLVDEILGQVHKQRLVLLGLLLGIFVLLTAWMTWHLRKVTRYMMALSKNYFGIKPRWAGDEIAQILSSAQQLREGIEHTITQANAIATGNYHHKVNLFSEQDQLGRALFNMTRALRAATIQNEQQQWLKTGQTQLHEQLRGEQDLVTLAKNIIVFLTTYVEATAGKFYLVKPPNLGVKLLASHAYVLRPDIRTEYELGEGLAGQAALEQQSILWTHIPKNYRYHQPTATDTGLENLFATPFYYSGQLKGVIELSFATIPTEIQCEFLEQIMPSLGIAINTAESRTEIKTLL